MILVRLLVLFWLLVGQLLSRAYDSPAVVRDLGLVTVEPSLVNPLTAPYSCLHLHG